MSTQPQYQMPYGGPPQPPGGPTPAAPVGAFIGLGGALLAIIGSCGTWVSASFLGQTLEVSGLDQDGDGRLTLVLAIVAVALLALGAFLPALKNQIWPPIVVLVAGVLILLILLINLINGAKVIGDANKYGASISPGWGVILLLIGTLVFLAGAVVQLVLILKAKRGPALPGQPFPAGPQGHMPAQQPYVGQPPQQYGSPQHGQHPPQHPGQQPWQG
ncbi:hypothetical protein EII34_02300 [Arachnia propionica]|uniref:Uncharacterized protein n=1 Tax=Arachnia propionica TaxID=1750 RepID=A0A3P1TD11_9ACTN|nr:hypothetical protein [Arachnia propionica]RRD07337.1 hypothetical protein EII34_02300 [Arachnia propionica]